MPIGVIINALSVLLGGLAGGIAGHKLSHEFKTQLNLIFGVCSMGMGISTIALMENMPAVIFSLIIGTAIGLWLHFGQLFNRFGQWMQKVISRLIPSKESDLSEDEFTTQLVTVIVLFCASGTGIYGSLVSGMTGDSSILISKSILDFFTAAIFACNLGYVISIIAVPQFIFFLFLFFSASFIVPFTDATMINDFKACGGFLMLATGFRMVQIKQFPTADMIPAMILVMPFSWIWVHWILQFL